MKHGEHVIDGATYTVYEHDIYIYNNNDDDSGYNQKSIYSIRKDGPRHCGSIDVTAHIRKYEELSIELLNIQKVMVYGYIGNNE